MKTIFITLAIISLKEIHIISAKVFSRCELAAELSNQGFPNKDIQNWVCLVEAVSQGNSSRKAGPNANGYYEWGLFQINNQYWCKIGGTGGGCNVDCNKLILDDITDASNCARLIFDQHGFPGWWGWTNQCQKTLPDLSNCGFGRVFERCELALELEKHKFPVNEIPDWVCLIEAVSRRNTSLKTGPGVYGFYEWGLFQINNQYWCKDGEKGGGCNVDCNKLITNDITDAAECAKNIHLHHGFEGWDGWSRKCRKGLPDLSNCGLSSRITPPQSENTCLLPNFPDNGNYVVKQHPNLTPGATVEAFTLLEYHCNENYTLSDNSVVHCLNDGQWSSSPKCVKMCKPLTSLTVNFKCTKGGVEVPCNRMLEDGTVATTTCVQNHFSTENLRRRLVCNRGWWSHPIPKCNPECGEEKGQGLQLIIGGKEVRRGEFPWHLGIYSWIEDPDVLTQVCGGTILTVKVAISAAHCFWNSPAQILNDPSLYEVAAGKLFRDYDHSEDAKYRYVQKSELEKILLPDSYGGNEQQQQADIAIMILSTPFTFSESVHPVCLDLSNSAFDQSQTARGKFGKGAGWGVTSEGGLPSSVLKVVELPVVDYADCRDRMPFEFRRFLTVDKFCAGYLNGTTMCSGDSGGGLVFKTTELETERWYLRGIVSVGVPSETSNTCRKDSYSGFTRIFKHADWILEILDEYK